MEDLKPIDKYFGCNHTRYASHFNGRDVNVMGYDVSRLMQQCAESYVWLAGGPKTVQLREVKTHASRSLTSGSPAVTS